MRVIVKILVQVDSKDEGADVAESIYNEALWNYEGVLGHSYEVEE